MFRAAPPPKGTMTFHQRGLHLIFSQPTSQPTNGTAAAPLAARRLTKEAEKQNTK